MLIRRGFVGLLLVLALWRCGAVALAQPLDRATLLANLDAPDFATRAAASHTLLLAPELTEETWAGLFAAARTPEQRHRLLIAARHHLITALRRTHFPADGRGSLGVTQHVISPDERERTSRSGVLINATFPGFPAYAHLLPGDLIVSFNGTDIDAQTTNERFIELVQLHHAGQPVTITVIRDGRPVTHQVILASLDALHKMYERRQPSPMPVLAETYEAQWRQFRTRMLGHSTAAAPIQIQLLQ